MSEVKIDVAEGTVNINSVKEKSDRLIAEIEKAIVGKRETVMRAVLALLCGGHVLLEDIPGVGKTTLAKAIARSIGGEFRRIQFTPDLLPADITGSAVFNQATSQFEFRPGPIFGNVILADEINRATPKTQSALLESMEEHQVTADGETMPLPPPFFVIATQNSIEMTGTYPLPEAQLDRFFVRLEIGYPNRASEAAILLGRQEADPLDTLQAVMSTAELVQLQRSVTEVFVNETIVEYIVDIVRASRESQLMIMGASPRGSLHLMRASQAHAAMTGNSFVRPDDVKAVAPSVLGHRVLARAEVRMRDRQNGIDEAIKSIAESVKAPVLSAR